MFNTFFCWWKCFARFFCRLAFSAVWNAADLWTGKVFNRGSVNTWLFFPCYSGAVVFTHVSILYLVNYYPYTCYVASVSYSDRRSCSSPALWASPGTYGLILPPPGGKGNIWRARSTSFVKALIQNFFDHLNLRYIFWFVLEEFIL